MREDGAVLLLVLLGLAILAALAGVALRLGQSGIAGLRAEEAVLSRSLTEDSALALISSRLGRGDMARDGSSVVLPVTGAKVEARVHDVAGMVNPAHARPQILQALLQARGASPDQALALTTAILAARSRGAFAGPWDLSPLFAAAPGLWARVAPDLTFLGNRNTVSPDLAAPDLQAALAGVIGAGADLTAAPPQAGLYEIDLRTLPAAGQPAPPFTRFSLLRDRRGHWHQFFRSWPMEMPG